MVKSFRIVVDGKPYTVEISDLSESSISVVVNGERFEVEIEREPSKVETEQRAPVITPVRPERKVELAPVAPETTRPAVAPAGVIAPMPGKVLAIKVKVGDQVSYGQELLILEAMKMEQSIKAAQKGVVKAIRVTVGQSVSYGDVMIEFE